MSARSADRGLAMDVCRGLGRGRVATMILAAMLAASWAQAGDHRPRVVPPNAVQPPGASFEGYPSVGRAQAVRIVEEAACATVSQTAHAPLRSTAEGSRRFAERLGVRARELLPGRLTGRLLPFGSLDDGGAEAITGDLGGGAGGPATAARLTLLPSSEEAVDALLVLVAGARSRVDLMIYGWEDDPTGREVAAALAARARAGVRVRLLVDRTGALIHNAAIAEGRCTFLDELRAVPNVTLIEPPGAHFRFDHRKLAVIDGRIAWTGGMILTEVARRRWHNLAFLAEGPIVAQYACLFEERWEELGCPPEPIAPVGGAPAVAPANASVRLIRTDVGVRTLKRAIYHAVDHARHHIYLENPYFSDEILAAKLVAARKRGVDVRAVLTLRGNMKSLNQFETITANQLVRAGARVYLYPAMTHVKAMTADGVWSYIGTGNFDELSLRNNREVGLSVVSPGIARELESRLFLRDMAASEELTALLPPPKGRLRLQALSLWY